MDNQLQMYKNQAYLRPLGQSEKSYAEGKPSQSHFYAGKLLRSRRLWAISGSSSHLFCMSFLLLCSRDLEEHYQISLVTNWHCCSVFFEH